MTRVRFVKQPQPEKARLLCQVAELAYAEQPRLLVYLRDPNQALALDRFMWTWDKGSFLPHIYATGAMDCHDEPIVLTTHEINPNGARFLIMANPCSLAFAATFEQVIDLAEVYDEALARQSRERFVRYREQGWAPELIELTAEPG